MEECNWMTSTHKMTAIVNGGSTRIALPGEWAKAEHVHAGMKLDVIALRGCVLIMSPRPMSQKEMDEMMTDAKTMVGMKLRERGTKL
jgi:hypothetical protein